MNKYKLTPPQAIEILEWWHNDYNKSNQAVVISQRLFPCDLVAEAFLMGANALKCVEKNETYRSIYDAIGKER